ncbi:hypothetical protein BV898_17799 [Hypsibius exemplaris]|uniref:Uncharacterized protein n=1 Tax=Hypsibius exemplaris TaxID=2072580 RepID=A0A9X6NMW4_HYPEX|nr:hypothetical protein BV898_17799 [Hypsibius exemplaris]
MKAALEAQKGSSLPGLADSPQKLAGQIGRAVFSQNRTTPNRAPSGFSNLRTTYLERDLRRLLSGNTEFVFHGKNF